MNSMIANVSPLITMIYNEFNGTQIGPSVTKIKEFGTVSVNLVTNPVTQKNLKKKSKRGI
jgi:hypothetical protein